MTEKPLYRFDGLVPRTDVKPGGFCLRAYLDEEFALEALNHQATRETQDGLQNLGREILSILPGMKTSKAPYSFVERSLLIYSIRVPGDLCLLKLDPGKIGALGRGESIEPHKLFYEPNNIDNPIQAYALITLFEQWINFAEINLGR